MTIQDLIAKDSNFNTSLFVSKANNLLNIIYNCISLGDVERIKPFVSNDVYLELKNKVDQASARGEKINYEEVNVSCEIKDVVENSTGVEIVVNATTKYLKYYTSIIDGHFLRGNTDNRTKVINVVIFQKDTNTNEKTYNCLGCGAPINIYNDIKCSSCGRLFDFSDFDYIIKKIN